MTEYANQARTARPGWRHQRLWWLLATALVAWAGSWRVLYLEVTRWHHMDAYLRFTPPPVPPGASPPHAGLPVTMARAVAVAAPPVAVAAALLLIRSATRSPRDDERSDVA